MPLAAGDDAPTVTASQSGRRGGLASVRGTDGRLLLPERRHAGVYGRGEPVPARARTYRDAGVDVYGVSVDDVDSHRSFPSRRASEFDLLADPDAEIADAFDVERRDSGVKPPGRRLCWPTAKYRRSTRASTPTVTHAMSCLTRSTTGSSRFRSDAFDLRNASRRRAPCLLSSHCGQNLSRSGPY